MTPSKLTSATKSYMNLKKAVEVIGKSVNQSTEGFIKLGNVLRNMCVDKHVEEDRMLYLKEIQKYTGYRITSFHDLKNV